jgi:hypothetical protein
MRTLKAAVFATVVGGSIALFGSPSAHAAVLSVGPSNSTFGGYQCADVRGGSITSGAPIQAWDCHAGPDQQYEFNNFTIYAVGGQRCVDVQGAGTAAGTPVQSFACNGTVAQLWYYYNGEIFNPNSGKCLDATNMANGTQLIINDCNGAPSQNWQIK